MTEDEEKALTTYFTIKASGAVGQSAGEALGGIMALGYILVWGTGKLIYKFWTYKPKTRIGRIAHNFARTAFALTTAVSIGGYPTASAIQKYRRGEILNYVKEQTQQYGSKDGIVGDLPDLSKTELSHCLGLLAFNQKPFIYIAPLPGAGQGVYLTGTVKDGLVQVVLPQKVHVFTEIQGGHELLCSAYVDPQTITPRFENKSAYENFLLSKGLCKTTQAVSGVYKNAYPPIAANTETAYLTEELVNIPWPSIQNPILHVTLPKGTKVSILRDRYGEYSGVEIPGMLGARNTTGLNMKRGDLNKEWLTPQKIEVERDNRKFYNVIDGYFEKSGLPPDRMRSLSGFGKTYG